MILYAEMTAAKASLYDTLTYSACLLTTPDCVLSSPFES